MVIGTAHYELRCSIFGVDSSCELSSHELPNMLEKQIVLRLAGRLASVCN